MKPNICKSSNLDLPSIGKSETLPAVGENILQPKLIMLSHEFRGDFVEAARLQSDASDANRNENAFCFSRWNFSMRCSDPNVI